MTGPAFQADARSVHMVIKSLVVGEHVEQWVKAGYIKKNGRDDLANSVPISRGRATHRGVSTIQSDFGIAYTTRTRGL